jgi:hypothetical protein
MVDPRHFNCAVSGLGSVVGERSTGVHSQKVVSRAGVESNTGWAISVALCGRHAAVQEFLPRDAMRYGFRYPK